MSADQRDYKKDAVITQAQQIIIHARVSSESAEDVLVPRYLVGALRDALIQLFPRRKPNVSRFY